MNLKVVTLIDGCVFRHHLADAIAGITGLKVEELVTTDAPKFASDNPEAVLVFGLLGDKRMHLLKKVPAASLLYDLRLNQIWNPVVFLSFESPLAILRRNPQLSLIASPGCVFLRMPFTRAELQDTLQHASQDRVSKSSVARHMHFQERLAALERIDKHELANKFGAFSFALALEESGAISGTSESVREIIEKNASSDSFREYVLLRNLTDPVKAVDGSVAQLTIVDAVRDFNRKYERRFKAIYIDDHWEDGWGRIFANLFGLKDEPFKHVGAGNGVCKNETVELQCRRGPGKEFEEGKHVVPYNVILLDLNLLGRTEAQLPVEERSGYRLLKRIREIDLCAPVIMFTASEKAQNLRELQKLGIREFVSKLLYGDALNVEIEKLNAAIVRVLDQAYARNLWNDISHLERNPTQQWVDHREERESIVSILKQCYFELIEAPAGRSYEFSRNPFNVVLQNCHNILIEIFAKQVLEIEDSSAGIMLKKLSQCCPDYNEFIYGLNRFRNSLVHHHCQGTRGEAVLYLVILMSLLLKNKNTEGSKLLKSLLEEIGAPTLTATDASLNHIDNLIRAYQYWELAGTFKPGNVVQVFMTSFYAGSRGSIFCNLTFDNGYEAKNYLVLDSAEGGFDLRLSKNRKRIQEEIDRIKIGASKNYHVFPPREEFVIQSFDHVNLNVMLRQN